MHCALEIVLWCAFLCPMVMMDMFIFKNKGHDGYVTCCNFCSGMLLVCLVLWLQCLGSPFFSCLVCWTGLISWMRNPHGIHWLGFQFWLGWQHNSQAWGLFLGCQAVLLTCFSLSHWVGLQHFVFFRPPTLWSIIYSQVKLGMLEPCTLHSWLCM